VLCARVVCPWLQLIETYHSAGKTSTEIPDLGPVELIFHEMCTEMNNRQAQMAAQRSAAAKARAAAKHQREAEGRPGVVMVGPGPVMATATVRATAPSSASSAQRAPQPAPPAITTLSQLSERTILPLTAAQVANFPADSLLSPSRKWVPGGVRDVSVCCWVMVGTRGSAWV
jgi:hypothetical protein